MFKFIANVIVVVTVILPILITAKPGDFTDAAETVDVPPEHRAAPPVPPQQHPVQTPFQPRAIYPVAAMPAGGPQYPLFFTTRNGFVPFGSIYSAFPQEQQQQLHQTTQAIGQSPIFLIPQGQPIASPIIAAVL